MIYRILYISILITMTYIISITYDKAYFRIKSTIID